MSHNEYQNWIDYLETEKLTKKNIVKYIDMYEKYTLKRLREVVKYHNKAVRKEATIMKNNEIKSNVIKVTDYKTKEALIARMKKGKKYHEKYLLGLQASKPDKEKLITEAAEEALDEYTKLLSENKKDEAKKYLDGQAWAIDQMSQDFNVDRAGTITEFKNELKKQAKKQLKEDAAVEKDYDKAAGSKAVEKMKPKKKAVSSNSYVEKIAKAKPEQKKKLIETNVKLAKKGDTVNISKLPKDQQQLLLALSKLSNPLGALNQLVKKKEESLSKPTPKPTKTKPAKPEAKKLPDSDQLFIIKNQLIEDLTEKVQESKKNKFGKDYKKFNKARANLIANFKEKSKKNGVSPSETDRYFKEILQGELADLAQLYINVNTLVYEAHVMPDGKIMENKKMKKEQVSAVQNKEAPKKEQVLAVLSKDAPKVKSIFKEFPDIEGPYLQVIESYKWLDKYDEVEIRFKNKDLTQIQNEIKKIEKEFEAGQKNQLLKQKPLNEILKSEGFNNLPESIKKKIANKIAKNKKQYEKDIKATFKNVNVTVKQFAQKQNAKK